MLSNPNREFDTFMSTWVFSSEQRERHFGPTSALAGPRMTVRGPSKANVGHNTPSAHKDAKKIFFTIFKGASPVKFDSYFRRNPWITF